MNQLVASKILRSLGCRFDVVENGLKAVEACVDGGYDVIFMDCHMPHMVSAVVCHVRLMMMSLLPRGKPAFAVRHWGYCEISQPWFR